MTAPRIVVSGATTALTRRTTLRKAFLAPWHELVQQVWLFALAEAQRKTDVAVHHGVNVITHHHLDVTPSSANLPEFAHRLHHDISCALNDLLAATGYDTPGELFDKRSTHMMRLLDARAQAIHLLYEQLNCVAAGLVERPENMPGFTFDFGLWKTGIITVRRPPIYFDKSRPEELELIVTPPPLLYREFGGDLDRLIHHMRRLSEDGIRALRKTRTRPVLGARRVRGIHPWSEPRTMRRRSKHVPTFRVGDLSEVGQARHRQAVDESRAWRTGYEKARQSRIQGGATPPTQFPFGTYEMRVRHRAATEANAPEHALLAMPGPLLCDVKAELEAVGTERESVRQQAHSLVDDVRDVLCNLAPALTEAAHVEFAEPTATRSAQSLASTDTSSDASSGPGPVVVRHHLERGRDRETESARRLVVLRDRRRGRPRGGRHGSDPPS